MRPEVRQKVIQRALELAGGRTLLSAMLGVEQVRLDEWIDGRIPVPEDAFEAATEIVLMDDVARAGEDRRGLPRDWEPSPF
ncbi:MAG: hypothetical protein ACT4P4_14945 [Betaproteobacteria bacterium]